MNVLWTRASADDAGAGGEKPLKPPAGAQTEEQEATTAATAAATESTDAADTATQAPSNPETHQPPKRPLLQRNHLSAPPPPAPVPAAPSVPAPPTPQQLSTTPDNTANNTANNANANPPQLQPPGAQPGQPGQPHQQPQQQQQQQQSQHQQQQQPPPQDSLSLAQLRRIVAEFPRSEPIAYDYVYADTAPLDEEIDEWFMYNFWQWVRLTAANRAFHTAWGRLFPAAAAASSSLSSSEGSGGSDVKWDDEGDEAEGRRRVFVGRLLEGVKSADRIARAEAVGALVYLVLGRWSESLKGVAALGSAVLDGEARSAATPEQLAAMKEGVRVVAECGGVEVVWEALRGVFELFWWVVPCLFGGADCVLTGAGRMIFHKTYRWRLKS